LHWCMRIQAQKARMMRNYLLFSSVPTKNRLKKLEKSKNQKIVISDGWKSYLLVPYQKWVLEWKNESRNNYANILSAHQIWVSRNWAGLGSQQPYTGEEPIWARNFRFPRFSTKPYTFLYWADSNICLCFEMLQIWIMHFCNISPGAQDYDTP